MADDRFLILSGPQRRREEQPEPSTPELREIRLRAGSTGGFVIDHPFAPEGVESHVARDAASVLNHIAGVLSE